MDANSSPFDPSTLSPDDPLRDSSVQEWIDKVRQDHPELAGQLATDPQGAIRGLADRGVAPPPMSFADPMLNNNPVDPQTGMVMPPGQSPDPTANQGPFRLDQGAAPPPTVPAATPLPAPAPATPSPIPALQNALDPEENPNPVAPGTVPTPTPRPTDTDLSAQKKKKADDGSGDFAKMIAALKPVPPPALNPVGTPSVRSPLAAGAPNLTQLLQVLGAQATPNPVNTLGRLLVAGKA